MITQTMDQMAHAVLRGDEAAALALADALQEARGDGAKHMPPVRHITADAARLRALVFLDLNAILPDADAIDGMTRDFEQWLRGERRVMLLVGVERVEVYEAAPPVV